MSNRVKKIVHGQKTLILYFGCKVILKAVLRQCRSVLKGVKVNGVSQLYEEDFNPS